SAFRLGARDLVEPLDLACDRASVAEAGAGRRHRPVGLWERDHARVRRIAAEPPVDRAELAAVAIIAGSLNDVVRADEQGDQRRAERRDERQLLVDEGG